MRRVASFALFVAAASTAFAAEPAPGSRLSFVSCPIVRDTATVPCWLTEYQGEGGSFPVVIRGKGRIGTITVSGLSGEEDHNLAVEGIRRFLKNQGK